MALTRLIGTVTVISSSSGAAPVTLHTNALEVCPKQDGPIFEAILKLAPKCLTKCPKLCEPLHRMVAAFMADGNFKAARKSMCAEFETWTCMFEDENLKLCMPILKGGQSAGLALPMSRKAYETECHRKTKTQTKTRAKSLDKKVVKVENTSDEATAKEPEKASTTNDKSAFDKAKTAIAEKAAEVKEEVKKGAEAAKAAVAEKTGGADETASKDDTDKADESAETDKAAADDETDKAAADDETDKAAADDETEPTEANKDSKDEADKDETADEKDPTKRTGADDDAAQDQAPADDDAKKDDDKTAIDDAAAADTENEAASILETRNLALVTFVTVMGAIATLA